MRVQISALIVAMGLTPHLGGRSLSDVAPAAVTLEQSQIDLSPQGITFNDCMVVHTDGSFHIERRKQQLPAPSATLEIYESSLNAEQMSQLLSILDQEKVRELPPFVIPHIPGNPPARSAFEAKIVRPDRIQSVGYADWPGRDQVGTAEAPPSEVQGSQQTAAIALQALVDWFRRVEGPDLRRSDATATHCGMDK